jgi:hypothetical protein
MMIEKTTDPSPPAPSTEVASTLPDKLAPFRPLFGMPVAVQFAQQTPYVQVTPQLNRKGLPVTAVVPQTNKQHAGQIIGMPAVPDQPQIAAVALGVLRASEDGTWLVIEERIGIPNPERLGRDAEPLGQVLMDVYVRPEMVTHISFVKAVELRRHEDS